LWGRLVICGGVSIRLRDAAASRPRLASDSARCERRIANPPQVNNLPHISLDSVSGNDGLES